MLGWLTICNPENRRTKSFVSSLRAYQQLSAQYLPYSTLLSYPERLRELLEQSMRRLDSRKVLLRIESPGENYLVQRGFIALGAKNEGSRIDSDQAQLLKEERGRILYQREWFAGFKQFLEELSCCASEVAHALGVELLYMNAPEDIVRMFHKGQTQKSLQDAAIAIPKYLPPTTDYSELRILMQNNGLNRVFIKMEGGSSASGVVAYEVHVSGKMEQATTTVDMVETRGGLKLYNSLRICRYKKHQQIKKLINALLQEGAHCEEWISKERLTGHAFDMRILVIDGQASHRVVRMSKTPFTNLHLGNKRGKLSELCWDAAMWRRVENVAEKTAAVFKGSLYVAVDLALPAGSHSPCVFEVNAFGDLLPELLFEGRDTYSKEIHACLSRHASDPCLQKEASNVSSFS